MITSEGTIKVSTLLDVNMQKELNKKPFILSLASTILGGVGVAVCFVLYIIAEYIGLNENTFLFVMIIFAAILGLGIGLLILVNKSLKQVSLNVKENTYEFFGDYFTITETLNGEVVGNAKIYNSQILKSRESANYLFFFISAGAAYPVLKKDLSEKEIDELRKIFRLRKV